MYTATLFRQLYGTKEYRTIRVKSVADVSDYTTNGWRCIECTKSYF